jgi:four helix bundle protein
MKIHKFQDLECWQIAREFVKVIYAFTNKDAFKTDYALKEQIRHSSISIMANIAEGFSRNSDKEFLRFLDISRSSLSETLSHLYIALDQNYISESEFQKLYLGSFVKKLKGILNKRLNCHSGLSRIFLKKDSEQVGMTQTEGFPTSGNDIHSTKAGMTYKHQLSLLKLAST